MRSTVLILGLFLMLPACAASADEVVFSCNYQLGAESDAKRRKVGSVVIAIDVSAKTARIDFGKGWFKTMSLRVDGTDIKETSPPTSGSELGFFYFDLAGNSGGFTGGTDPHEFFDACVRTNNKAVAGTPYQTDAPSAAMSPGSKKEAHEPAEALAAPNGAAQPPTGGQARPEYFGGKDASRKLAPASGATAAAPFKDDATKLAAPSAAPNKPAPSPAGQAATEYLGERDTGENAAAVTDAAKPDGLKKEETGPAAAPASPTQPTPPPTGEQATTEYFGKDESKKPLSVPKANEGPDSKKETTRAPTSEPVLAPSNQLASPLMEGHGTTEYFGGKGAHEPLPEATVTPGITEATEAASAPRVTSPAAASPSEGAIIASCRDAIGAAAQSAKVNFANSSFVVEPGSRVELAKIAKIIKDCGGVVVEVGGHTDNFGDPADNKKLSQLRADAVASFLIGEGVASSNLKAVGYGQEQPIATNATAAGRRLNRRVEFSVSGP